MNKYLPKKLLGALGCAAALSLSISTSQAGMVIGGDFTASGSIEGNASPHAQGDNSRAMVDVASAIGDIDISGSANLNASVNGNLTPVAAGADSCASVRLAVVSDQPACGGGQVASGGESNGGGWLGTVGNIVEPIIPFIGPLLGLF